MKFPLPFLLCALCVLCENPTRAADPYETYINTSKDFQRVPQNPANIKSAALADAIDLSREDWYRLLVAARGQPLP